MLKFSFKDLILGLVFTYIRFKCSISHGILMRTFLALQLDIITLNAATKKRNTWDQTKVLDLPGHASLLPLSIDSLEQREIVLTQEIILTLFRYWLFFLSFFNEV